MRRVPVNCSGKRPPRTRSRIRRSPRAAGGVAADGVPLIIPTRAGSAPDRCGVVHGAHGRGAAGTTRTVRDLAAVLPQIGRLFDEAHERFPCLVRDRARAARGAIAVAAAIADVSGNLAPSEVRGAEAMLGYIRSGRAWLVLHEQYGLAGDEIRGDARLGRRQPARRRAGAATRPRPSNRPESTPRALGDGDAAAQQPVLSPRLTCPRSS